jgi:hypothetical protein
MIWPRRDHPWLALMLFVLMTDVFAVAVVAALMLATKS